MESPGQKPTAGVFRPPPRTHTEEEDFGRGEEEAEAAFQISPPLPAVAATQTQFHVREGKKKPSSTSSGTHSTSQFFLKRRGSWLPTMNASRHKEERVRRSKKAGSWRNQIFSIFPFYIMQTENRSGNFHCFTWEPILLFHFCSQRPGKNGGNSRLIRLILARHL